MGYDLSLFALVGVGGTFKKEEESVLEDDLSESSSQLFSLELSDAVVASSLKLPMKVYTVAANAPTRHARQRFNIGSLNLICYMCWAVWLSSVRITPTSTATASS